MNYIYQGTEGNRAVNDLLQNTEFDVIDLDEHSNPAIVTIETDDIQHTKHQLELLIQRHSNNIYSF